MLNAVWGACCMLRTRNAEDRSMLHAEDGVKLKGVVVIVSCLFDDRGR